jgi:multidrug resistance efflux pump
LLAAEGVIPAALINTAKADLQRAQAERNFVKAKLEFAQAALEFARATGDKSSTQPAVRPNAEELSLAELEDRAAWTIRMQKKGYATQAQVDQELDKLAKARRDSSIPHAEEVDFRKREAELQVADVNFKTKTIEVDRLAELAKKGYIPAQTVEKAKSELLRAQAELNLAKVNLEVALAALERSRARRQRNLQKDAVLPQIIAPPKEPELSLPELEEKVELLTKMQKKGYVAQAQVDRARIELAKTTIGNELKKFVELREQLVVQAKQAFAAKSISQQELDQAIADLDDAKKRLKDWK